MRTKPRDPKYLLKRAEIPTDAAVLEPSAGQGALAELVQTGLAQSEKQQLAQSALSGWALGSADFVGELQQSTTRRLVPGKAGRPAKKTVG